jgi:hypothetical protein
MCSRETTQQRARGQGNVTTGALGKTLQIHKAELACRKNAPSEPPPAVAAKQKATGQEKKTERL